MSLQIVKSKQQIYVIILKYGKTALQNNSADFHISQMDSSKNSRGTHSFCHSRKSSIHQVKDSTLFRTIMGDDRRLGSRINESLDWLLVHQDVNVEHVYWAKEFWELFLSCFKILHYHVFLNLLFNHLLGFFVIGVSIHHPGMSLLFFLFGLHLRLNPFTNNLLKLIIITSFKRSCQFWIIILQESTLMWVIGPYLLYLSNFLFNVLILLIMVKLWEHLFKRHFRDPFDVLI